jgi:rhodanese-related sulfurtransferase/rubrerythrin
MTVKPEFEDVTTEDLRRYMDTRKEKDYMLVDVRQPEEYSEGHIPGARLIPLGEIESRLSELPLDKEMVFNCKSGGRSRAAATIVADSRISEKKIYNLLGGFMGWEGKAVEGLPKIHVFDKAATSQELIQTAMDLEKGAFRFYTHLTKKYGTEPFVQTIDTLVNVELAHAKTLYKHLDASVKGSHSFENMFEALKGDILEGGENLSEIIEKVDSMEGNLCLNLLELALNIEYAAYDLYKNLAAQVQDPDTKTALLAIAQAEKNHMKTIAKAVAQCP